MHDMLSELAGLRAELDNAERYGKADRAKAVRAEIARVADAVSAQVETLRAQAGDHERDGQDVLAVQKRREARRLAAALDPPAAENTADAMPRQTATTRKPKGA